MDYIRHETTQVFLNNIISWDSRAHKSMINYVLYTKETRKYMNQGFRFRHTWNGKGEVYFPLLCLKGIRDRQPVNMCI